MSIAHSISARIARAQAASNQLTETGASVWGRPSEPRGTSDAAGAKKSGRSKRVVLESPLLQLEILPHLGGGIARFDWCDGGVAIPILRRCADPANVTDPNQLACYPLLPFSNRIGGGRFEVDGRVVSVSRNRDDEPCPIHGDGWLSRWQVQSQTDSRARLVLDRSGETPYAYRAAQSFELDDATLTITLEIQNAGTETLPFGLGLHPFIERDGDTMLAAPANGLWLSGRDWLSTEHVRTPPAWHFGVAYPLPDALVNHAFTDWAGWMTAHWPQRQLLLTMHADTDCFVLYTPPSRDWFCFEPVDHPINAMNLAGGGAAHGMTLLAPGESLERTFSLAVERTGERTRPPGRQTFFSTMDEMR